MGKNWKKPPFKRYPPIRIVSPSCQEVTQSRVQCEVLTPKPGASEIDEEISDSPTVSATLGDEDSDSESSVDEHSVDEPHVNTCKATDDTKPNQSEKAPWVNLFKNNRNMEEGFNLHTCAKKPEGLVLEDDDLDDVDKAWGHCLIGYFVGRFPGKAALLRLCDSWKVKYQYYFHPSGWQIFKFQDEASRASVLQGGTYYVFGRALMLKIMPRCFEFDDSDISILPVWINLPGLPLDCWNPRALSKIVSMVGKPISTDKLTSTKERLSYARVLVEIDVSKELMKSIQMKFPTGKTRNQEVIYEHVPKFCGVCKMFGHSTSTCYTNKTGEVSNEDVSNNLSKKIPPKNVQVVAGKKGQILDGNGQQTAQIFAGNEQQTGQILAGIGTENVAGSKVIGQNHGQMVNGQIFAGNAAGMRFNGQKTGQNTHNAGTKSVQVSNEKLEVPFIEVARKKKGMNKSNDKFKDKLDDLHKKRITPILVSK